MNLILLVILNIMVILIINRGILAPNCFWWDISSRYLEDASGIDMYNKQKGPIVPVNMLGENMYLVRNIGMIRTILDNSPFIFGVGKLKYQIFSTFMPKNLGVSEGCPWINRRKLNEEVLDTGLMHEYANFYNKFIQNIVFNNKIPENFSDFMYFSKKITTKIVFNQEKVNENVFKIFSEANSLKTFFFKNYKLDNEQQYLQYLIKNIHEPVYPGLVYLSTRYSNNVNELINQIPHWIFPIGNLIHTAFPRLLLLLCNHKGVFMKLLNELKYIDNNNAREIYNCTYLRYCILEMLRLNNPVVTMFRTLLRNFAFNEKYQFKKGTQFVILTNPILRDGKYFDKPDCYIPERWSKKGMEDSYYAIMFSQGPQKCPGKDLALFLLASYTVNYMHRIGAMAYGPGVVGCQKINVMDIPQMINPCTIKFTIKNE